MHSFKIKNTHRLYYAAILHWRNILPRKAVTNISPFESIRLYYKNPLYFKQQLLLSLKDITMVRFFYLGKPATGKLDFTAQIRSGYSVDKVESGIAQFQVWTFDNGVTDVSIVKKKYLAFF